MPTIADRVAQTVAAKRLEIAAEPRFHPDSFGFRPNRSAHDAVELCRDRCWQRRWVVDLDIARFFDSVDWGLLMQAVESLGAPIWVALYVRRWVAVEAITADGRRTERGRGTPQGGPVSPVLANLFLHYAFDTWMAREYPTVRFERYADDVIVHCVSLRQARQVLAAIEVRLGEVGLALYPDKTSIVYCGWDRAEYWDGPRSFTFLGFEFRRRGARTRERPRLGGVHGAALVQGWGPGRPTDEWSRARNARRLWCQRESRLRGGTTIRPCAGGPAPARPAARGPDGAIGSRRFCRGRGSCCVTGPTSEMTRVARQGRTASGPLVWQVFFVVNPPTRGFLLLWVVSTLRCEAVSCALRLKKEQRCFFSERLCEALSHLETRARLPITHGAKPRWNGCPICAMHPL